MLETAQTKLDNLQTLQVCAKDQGMEVTISVDEDGFYYIGEKMFTNYKTALRSLVK